jgi:hypothetical protein
MAVTEALRELPADSEGNMHEHSVVGRPDGLLAEPAARHEQEVAAVRRLICSLQPFPLILVASPGSLPAAQLFAAMYEKRFGVLTRCCGIPEMVRDLPFLTSHGVLIVSVELERPAIVSALKHCLMYEPPKVGVLCRPDGQLSRIARGAYGVSLAETDSPTVSSSDNFELAIVVERAFGGQVRGWETPHDANEERQNDDIDKPHSIDWRVAAIRRKTRALGLSIQTEEVPQAFLRMLDDQIQKLNRQQFRALIIDYDGTLSCAPEKDRMPDAIQRLEPLLRNGVTIGFATGRDGRLASQLRKVLHPEVHRDVWLASANGTKIGRLDQIDDDDEVCAELQPLKAALESDPILRHVATVKASGRQLTICSKRLFSSESLWRIAATYARRCGVSGIQVVTSNHSIDILAPGATKLNLLDSFQSLDIRREQVLCIGDQGRWPGNDFALLEHEYALSADEPSTSWFCGWNVAPPGCRGPAVTLFYLQHMVLAGRGYFHLALPRE